MRKLHIILPVHNRKSITQEFIRLLKVQTYSNYHLILIDDGSDDGTEEMVRSHISSLTVIKGKGNWFWGGSIYQGIKYIKLNHSDLADGVLIANDDIIFDHEFLEKGAKALFSRGGNIIVASCYSQQTGRLLGSGVHADWRNLTFIASNEPDKINCATTNALFITVRDLLQIGDIHPKLIPHYLSDFEFTMRACKKGLKLVPEPSLTVFFNETTTRNITDRVSGLFDYFNIRSPEYIVSWTFFILMLCPARYKYLNLGRVWYQVLKAALREAGRFL